MEYLGTNKHGFKRYRTSKYEQERKAAEKRICQIKTACKAAFQFKAGIHLITEQVCSGTDCTSYQGCNSFQYAIWKSHNNNASAMHPGPFVSGDNEGLEGKER